MALRPCLDCGRLTDRTRCTDHERVVERARTRRKRQRRPAVAGEQQRRRTVVAAWRDQYGDWCPGWQRPPHQAAPNNPLTADHVTPYAASGTENGPLAVLCRRCNGAKGANG